MGRNHAICALFYSFLIKSFVNGHLKAFRLLFKAFGVY